MSRSRYKYPFIIGTSVLIIILLTGVYYFLQPARIEEKSPDRVENSSINQLLKSLDSTYWVNPQKSLKSVNHLINLSEKFHNNGALAMGLYYKAACYIMLERYDSAFILCHTALRYAEDQKNELIVGKMKTVLANYYLAKNEFNDANKCLLDAQVIFERLGTKKDIANALNGFGLLYYDLREPDKAIGYYRKVLSLSKEPDKKRQESVAYLNISNCYLNKQDYQRTLFYLNKAALGFKELHDSTFIMMCTMNRGIVSIARGDKEQGLSYYFQVLDYSRRMQKKILLGHTFFNIANVYYDNNMLDSAQKYFYESMIVYRSIPNRNGEKNVLQQLSKIEQSNNNWKQAYAYYDRYISIKDSILNADLLKNINDLQWKHDFQKKENETTEIRKQFEIKKRETVILVISFTLIILVVVLFGALIRLANKNLKKSDKLKELQIIHLQEQMAADEKINNLEKLRLQTEIEAKNKELTTSSLQLINKNDILVNISGIAESFYKKKALNDDCYSRLKSILKENLDQERDWEHFKPLFEDVHKDFFKNLKQTCPAISESELRLCAYLKINLQNKEIAKILNVTPDSLKTLRSRIRKKLCLEKEVILEDYIRGV
ncbi:MAG TPA: hypothetical protein VK172_10085 [Lentimicrobium sp.]|nr:hypothetical protein [Lentimicrobium sp.]